MNDLFDYPFLVRGFISVILLAPLLGGISHLVVARRMAFFSAALGQAAITGVCVGLLLGEPLTVMQMLGGLVVLAGIWVVNRE